MALFVLAVVGVVIAQTWLDWRESRSRELVPPWVRGVALAAWITASGSAAISFVSFWLRSEAGQGQGAFGPSLLWKEVGFLAAVLGILVVGVRKRQLRWIVLLAGVVGAILWLWSGA